MPVQKNLFKTVSAETPADNGDAAASATQGLRMHLDANDVDSYDGDGSVWVDISEFDVTVPLSDNADDLELHLNASDPTSYDPDSDTTTWSDISGNDNHATLTSMGNSSFGEDNGGYFNVVKTADYVTIPYDSTLVPSSSGYTFEGWFNFDEQVGGGHWSSLFGNWDTSGNADGMLLRFKGSNVEFFIHENGSSVFSSSGTASGISTNEWFHIAMTMSTNASGGAVKVYVNGEQKISSTLSGTYNPNSTQDLFMCYGGDIDTSTARYFDGKVGVGRIYSKALSAAEVAQNYRHGRDFSYDTLANKYNGVTPTGDYSSISTTSNHATRAPGLSDTSTTASIHDTTTSFSFGDSGNSPNTNNFTVTMDTAFAAKGFAVYERAQSNYKYTGTVDLYGSNDNSTFTKLGTTVQTIYSQYSRNVTTFSNDTDYLYYKFDFHSNNRGTYHSAWAVELLQDFDLSPELELKASTHANPTIGTVTSGPELELDANDYSGSGNWLNTGDGTGMDATITNATYINDLNSDYFHFDGTGDKISIPSNTVFNTANDFSMEFWFRRTVAEYDVDLLSTLNTSSPYNGFIFRFSSPYGLYFYDYSTNSYLRTGTGTNAFKLNRWSHIVLTWDASSKTPNIFVDGVDLTGLQALSIGTGTASYTSQPLTIGIGPYADHDYTGDFAQLRIYDKILSQSEVTTNYDATKEQYIYRLTDSSSNDRDVEYLGIDFDQELGDAMEFTGGSEHRVTIDDNGSLTNVDDFTVEMWAYVRDNNDYRYLWANLDTTNQKRQVYSYVDSSDRIEFTIYSGNGSTTYKQWRTSSVASTIHNKWVHYVFVLEDGLPSKLYLNGVDTSISVVGTGSGYGSGPMHKTSTTDFTVGANANSGNTANINGDIGQFRIYHKVLTDAQVMQNYLFNKKKYPNGTNATGTNIDSSDWNSDGYFDLSGSSEYFSGGELNPSTSGFTFTCWVNFDALNANVGGKYDTLFVAYQGTGRRILIYCESSNTLRAYVYQNGTLNNSTSIGSTATISTGSWKLISLVWTQGVNGKLYVDKTAVTGTANVTGTRPDKYDTFTIGNGNPSNDSFAKGIDGKIAGARWYDRPLSSSEIDALVDAGR